MTDFIDGLERDLVAAAGRRLAEAPPAAAAAPPLAQAPPAAEDRGPGRAARLGGPAARGRRRPRGRRGLAVALAGLLVAGTAAAAVVTLQTEPSKPLAGPVKVSAPNARAYEISLLPEFRAGNAGWCSTVRFSTGGRTTSSGMGCGPARAAGGNLIAGGGVQFSRDNVQYVIATARVRAVRFGDDGPVIATETDPALPNGWRYAVAVVRRALLDVPPPRPDDRSSKSSAALSSALRRALARSRPVLLDEAGHTLPSTTPADRVSRGARSRRTTLAEPARRCVIGRAKGFPLGYARVALGTPRTAAKLEGRAFASCAYSVFHRPGGRGGLTAMILLDAQHPSRQAADLPPTPGLDGRRLGRGWLAVYGGSAHERAALLARLHPRL